MGHGKMENKKEKERERDNRKSVQRTDSSRQHRGYDPRELPMIPRNVDHLANSSFSSEVCRSVLLESCIGSTEARGQG
jgi:hypothetical protein